MQTHSVYLGSLICLGCAALLASACGDEPQPPVHPEFSDLQIVCGSDEAAQGVEGPIFEEIRVKVTDPDRDLVSVEGTLNGLQIALSDPDADLFYSWSPTPDPEAEPMSCDGEFVVSLEATDAEGHTTEMYEIVPK
jgi:hypothetical protein